MKRNPGNHNQENSQVGRCLEVLVLNFFVSRLSFVEFNVSFECHDGNACCQANLEPFMAYFWAVQNVMKDFEVYLGLQDEQEN